MRRNSLLYFFVVLIISLTNNTFASDISTTSTNEQSGSNSQIQLNPIKNKSTKPTATDTKSLANISKGKQIYKKNCVACHGENGKGILPAAPDFTKKGGVLDQSTAILFKNIKNGIGAMPPKGGNPSLTDQDLNNAVDYLKHSFAPKEKGTLKDEVQELKQQLATLNQKFNTLVATKKKAAKTETIKSPSKVPSSKKKQVQIPNSSTKLFWASPDFSGLITGGASAGFSVPSGKNGNFDLLNFNPMFLFRYKDLLLLHADLDFGLDDDGNTQADLGNLNLNLFLNDYMVFQIGQFDSPLGYFAQNLSPDWINRLPTPPVGFDDDQAAPQNALGSSLRGGFNIFSTPIHINYILFVANGPRAIADPDTGLIDYVATDSFPKNYNSFISGGRIGILPIPRLEIGFSGAAGKAAVFGLASNMQIPEKNRSYESLGADISYKWRQWDLRGEAIEQEIGGNSNSEYPKKGKWKAWYLQAAYWIPCTKIQPIVRWGGYSSPVGSDGQHQVALGLDYWFAPSIVAKAAYEFNFGQRGSDANKNAFIIQFAIGF